MNVVRHQVRHLVLGMVKLLIPLVKNVVLLIATKPAVIMELTLALMAVAVHVNVAHQLRPPALHQVAQVQAEAQVLLQVVHLQVAQAQAAAQVQVVLHHLQVVVQKLMKANVHVKIIIRISLVLVIILIKLE